MPQGADILYGYHPVMEALRAGRRRVHTIRLARDKGSARYTEVVRLAEKAKIPVQSAEQRQLTAMSGTPHHQGICAETEPFPLSDVQDLVAVDPGRLGSLLLVILDQIVDPQNFGAIVRTAQCVGANGVVIPKDRSAPPSAAVSKASAGALEHMHLARVTNLASTLRMLKKNGLWIAGADRGGDTDLFHSDLRGPLALVMGAEEKGLRPLVRQQCDFTIAIPQSGPIGSLNASVAAGIILYEVFRQRFSAAGENRKPM